MNIERLDHLVLTVRDMDKTLDFYQRALGARMISFENKRAALSFGNWKINLHKAGQELEPKAQKPTPGAGDICVITSLPMEDVVKHMREHDVDVVEGPVERTGSCGPIQSIYVRDPDGNLIEISNDA